MEPEEDTQIADGTSNRVSSLHFIFISTGGDNSNKRCFGTKPKLLRESGDFSGYRHTWKFFREARDNSGTLQKKILEFMPGILKISGKVTQKFGRMIQIPGTTYVKTQKCSNSVC